MAGVIPYTHDDWKKTHADRIRSMTDEELADRFSLWCCRSKTDDSYCKSFGSCDKCWLDWLKQEVSTDGN